MTRTLDDAFVLLRAEELSALDFVVRLDSAADPAARARLVRDYVVTPAVAAALPALFARFKTAVERGEEYGHVLHGGFGSGKSHLMTILSMLLEGEPAAWDKDHPAFAALRSAHREWVGRSRLLVVRVHMLSARRTGSGLDDILYDAVNAALAARGLPELRVGGEAEALRDLRAEAAAYGPLFWKRASAAGVADGPDDVDAIEELGGEALRALTEAYLAMKGGAAGAALKPAWGEGLQRMTAHVAAQGFGGLVLLVDEFLLWLAEKAGEDFVAAINDMNTIVDHGTGRRAVPVLVVFARQRNIRDFFPDLTSQDRIQERLDHHAKRFETTFLQDVELRHIVRGRVLRDRRDPAAVDAAVAKVTEGYRRVLDDLVGDQGPGVLADVYPLHPALIDVLVDVSNLMQRERSALRLLYEILSANRDFPLGELLPVGRAFEHVFPPAGVEAAQKTELLQAIHREWYQRLAPHIDRLVARRADTADAISEDRARTLHQVVKTLLLGLVSTRLAGGRGERLTIDRLVKLNYADADGAQLKNKVNRTFADLQALALEVPELGLAGQGPDTVVSYALGQASFSDVLRKAEDKVRSHAALISAFASVFEPLLPADLAGLCASRDGLRWSTSWRGTKRTGRVLFCNVREASNEAIVPGPTEEFRLLVDYPWDDGDHSVDEDRQRVAAVRRRQGRDTSAAWLPRHLSATERTVLHQLAAARFIVDGGVGGELLRQYGEADRGLLVEQARARVAQLSGQVGALLQTVYGQHAEVKALIGVRDPQLSGAIRTDPDRIVHELLDWRFPQHPDFRKPATAKNLQVLAAWIDAAFGQAGSTHFDADTEPILQHLGRPLELVEVGQSRAQLERNGRFLKAVIAELGDKATMPWEPVAEQLRDTYGLTDEVLDLLLLYVCATGYRLRDLHTRDRVEPRIGMPRSRALLLERAELLDLPATSRARALAQEVFAVKLTDSHRSLSAQDHLAADLRVAAKALRDQAANLHEQLVGLGASGSPRQREVAALQAAAAPLVADGDSFTALTAWLAAWPDDDVSLRTQALALRETLAAAQAVHRSDRDRLLGARDGVFSARISACLAGLDERLHGTERDRPFRRTDADAFNREAGLIIAELLRVPPPPVPPLPPVLPPPPGVREEVHRIDTVDAAGIDQLVTELRSAHAGGDLVSVEIRLRKKTR